MKKTILFFFISLCFFALCCFAEQLLSKWSSLSLLLAYIIFCIYIFKDIKVRFLAYPIIVLNSFFGFCAFSFSGVGTSDGVALGYVFMFFFMFIIAPLLLISFIVGIIFDIMGIQSKNKQNSDKEKTA